MCGIFGLIDSHGAGVDPELLWCGTHAVRHRGPNDWGLFNALPLNETGPPWIAWERWEHRNKARGYRVGLGSRRLSILDLSRAGHQPMNLPGTQLWVTFNGEIYNYQELKTELSTGRDFKTNTDTEVLLAAYARWGIDCLSRFNGMFAFAIWDGYRKRVVLARDRFGEKPLYYSQIKGRFVFGSELKQFFADADFDRALDLSSVADFLFFSQQDHDERTFLAGIKQLPPAHWLEIDALSGEFFQPCRYWLPAIGDDLDRSRDSDFSEKLRFLLADAIRLRLRSDVRVGICLSGGLDSTGICSLMASQVPDPSQLSAYTITFPGFADDESGLASQAASKVGVCHQTASFDAADLWDQIQQFVYYQDGPTGGSSVFASWRVFQMARAGGTVVLLNGQGGDELLAGYNKFFFFWFQILFMRGRWARLVSETSTYLRVHRFDRWNPERSRRYFPLSLG
jgi:asparagine synthase (glutamine-hydrolysing)